MTLLVKLVGARRAIEIGVYTGYSSICIATALGEGGKLVACDVNDEWTRVAKRYWSKAGVADRIELHLRPAVETLQELAQAETEPFDFAFIDADKTNNTNYYESCLRLLRPGGLLVIDNALWGGSVAEADDQNPDTLAIRAINAQVAADERVDSSLIAVGDGLLLARKR
jgi:caffeoyl-CoA O-methyltransferase